MEELKETKGLNYKVLIITEYDTLEDISLKIRGNRYMIVFIHIKHPELEKVKEILKPSISVLETIVGDIYTYDSCLL